MGVVLRVVSGRSSGRRVWLNANQRLKVGATEWADFAIGSDSGLSSVHFSLRCERDACHVFDHESEYGTFVNGKRVSFSYLSHGDVIRAGLTRFRVEICN